MFRAGIAAALVVAVSYVSLGTIGLFIERVADGDWLGIIAVSILITTFLAPLWLALLAYFMHHLAGGPEGLSVNEEESGVPVQRGGLGRLGILATAGVAVVFFFGVVSEGVARLVDYVNSEPTGLVTSGNDFKVTFLQDPKVGHILSPKSDIVYYGEWGKTSFKANSLGFRGPEIPLQKPQDEIRVAVLGDSFIAGLELPRYDQNFVPVLERVLNESGVFLDKRVRVLQFGMSGDGTDNQLLRYQHQVRQFKPDLVLVAFYPGNKWADNYLGFDRFEVTDSRYSLSLSERSKDRLRQLGGVDPDTDRLSLLNEAKETLSQHSALYNTSRTGSRSS